MCIYGFVEKIQQDGVRKVSVASPFEGFNGFGVSMFQWLATFECLRRLNGFAVYGFQWLRRF